MTDTEKIVAELCKQHSFTDAELDSITELAPAVNATIQVAIRSALSRSEQKWIEVSDRQKPKDKEQVFVLLPNRTIGGKFTGWRGYLAEYNSEYDDFDSASGMVEFESGDIKFWESIPLPEPPTEGGK